MKATHVLAFLSGFVALSYEILWFRAYLFISGGVASLFGLLIGFYLLGIAAGSLASRSWCVPGDSPAAGPTAADLGRFILLANLLGYLLIPLVSWILTFYGAAWTWTLPLVSLTACGLGTVFPMISHWAVPPDERAGAKVAGIYFSNVMGSTAGSLVTGFWLCDVWPLRDIALFLVLLGTGMVALVPVLRPPGRRAVSLLLPTAFAVAVLVCLLRAPLFDHIYERMQFRFFRRPGSSFAHIIENRSGVITVTSDEYVFGNGFYDGSVNTSIHADRNQVTRVYALPGFHPQPREVLLIGLSSGSWAAVLAENPLVEHLTVVEINPGYLKILPHYPEVAGILLHPKVRIEIEDARRWMMRNTERKFDVILSNTTHHGRANITNILSTEFMQLARARLSEGGILFYGPTGSIRATKTGLSLFPHGLVFGGLVAVSDRPLAFNTARWMEVMKSYSLFGRPVVDLRDSNSEAWIARKARDIGADCQTRESVWPQLQAAEIITDDNMGEEWTRIPSN